MSKVEIFPYNSFKERMRIQKEHRHIRFTDLDGCLMYIENVGPEEMSAARLVREYKNNIATII
ncbi:hypothetical protein [Clostridium tagluense]|uniref:Uncharacterized protein n=1 Tax=Clostridium tagluense TaxID=360422 RepID=A0A401UUC9_9CLOT|nr:hypothetical protein [Clostridium tagluense]GCD13153.1 hypothetical protein Ctaglu_47760 [Clostridium tagluense]